MIHGDKVLENVKNIQINDLNDSDREFYLKSDKLKISNQAKHNYKILGESALLLAKIGNKLIWSPYIGMVNGN